MPSTSVSNELTQWLCPLGVLEYLFYFRLVLSQSQLIDNWIRYGVRGLKRVGFRAVVKTIKNRPSVYNWNKFSRTHFLLFRKRDAMH